MSPEKEQDFRGVSLKRELVEDIERFIIEFPKYKSIADFVHEATRVRMEQVRGLQKSRLEIINHDENGVKILDRELRKPIQVYLKPEGVWCETCEDKTCIHIDYVYAQPDVQKIIEKKRKEGWKI